MNATILVLEEFFAPAEAHRLRSFALDRESDFVPSEVISDDDHGRRDDDFRRSRVLFDVAEVHPTVAERVLHHLPQISAGLDLAPFDVREIELQITASNDGEWFRAHRDSGHGPVSTRELTFVYYCHREPRAFTGGELKMFGPFADPGHPDATSEAVTVTPEQNRMVFFPSHYLHEVAPVSCPSQQFADARLTFNGWLHR